MKKKIKDNLLFVILLVLLLIPKTRMLIQVKLQNVLGYLNQPKIEETYQGKVALEGKLGGINVDDLEVSNLENKIVVINYWATWCPPCVAEMPSFQKLYDQYQDNPEVIFLFLTADSGKRVYTFLNENRFTFPVYRERETVFQELEHTSIPTTFILNRKGEIKVKKTGAAQWNSQKVHKILSSLLAEK